MRKGIFIPDITVEMFKNASLEAVEELLVSGTMEDIEIPDQPHGEWIKKENNCYCSKCKFELESYILGVFYNFCPNCGADMRRKEGESE